MYDVISIGSNTTDVFVYTDQTKTICMKTLDDELCYLSYPIGSKLVIDKLDFHIGGGGTNTAVCMSRLGLKVGYLGKVGKESRAERVLRILEKENIDFLGPAGNYKGNKSGYSVILDSLEKQRTVLTHKGVNDYLFYDEIDLKRMDTGWLCMTSMMGESFRTLEKLSRYAKEKDIRIMFNPSNYLCERGAEYLEDLLKKVYILVLNDEEASLLVGKMGKAKKLKALKKMGPKVVLVTEGDKAVHCMDEKYDHYSLSPLEVKVVETTGAGDAFAATFLAGIIRGKDIGYSMKLASANSSSVLQHMGAKKKLLTMDEAEKLVQKQGIKVKKGDV